MAGFNYPWSSEGMRQPSMAELMDQMSTQLAELERMIDTRGNQSNQNDYYYQQQPSATPNYYHPSWPYCPDFSWSYEQDQFYAPNFPYPCPQPPMQKSDLEKTLESYIEQTNMSWNDQEVYTPIPTYSPEFSFQVPPPQEEQRSNLEETLNRYIESTEMIMVDHEVSTQEHEFHMEILAKIINSSPHKTFPSSIEISLEEEGQEQCEADTLDIGKELLEAVGADLEMSYPGEEEGGDIVNTRSEIEEEEKEDEDDPVLSSYEIKQISPVSVVRTVQNSEEYIQIDLGEGKENNLDEFKFGGGFQSFAHAMEFKEKTTRRHDMTIFAIEPD